MDVKKCCVPFAIPAGTLNVIKSVEEKEAEAEFKFHVIVFPVITYPGLAIDPEFTVTPAG